MKPWLPKQMIIGIDFDNTIVDYNKLMTDIAIDSGLIPRPAEPLNKRKIRNLIRDTKDGESKWRRVQAIAYGERMGEAVMMEGVGSFLQRLKCSGIPFYIVSHKTIHAIADPGETNLREAALEWMKSHCFFDHEPGLGLSETQVFFEDTRAEKIERIKKLGVTHFIDDLAETFEEKSFPETVVKILLGDGREATAPDVIRFDHWSDIETLLSGNADIEEVGAHYSSVKAAISRLLGVEVTRLNRICGGGNNRVFEIFCSSGAVYAGKQYLQPTREGLSRGEVEFGAFKFLKSHGVDEIPEAISYDPENNIAIYEYIDGNPASSTLVTDADIGHIVGFLCKLRELSRKPEAARLPRASAAAFSPAEAVNNIKNRYDSLLDCSKKPEESIRLDDFLSSVFSPAFETILDWGKKMYESAGMEYDRPIQRSQQTLSPSDTGFHNALRKDGGGITYIDFEYFGWDDPAKMISDFLLHPGMNLTPKQKTLFMEKMLSLFPDSDKLALRVRALYPLSAMQWALITLNEFIPANMQRRKFASSVENPQELRATQLDKAKNMVNIALEKICRPEKFFSVTRQ